jgi:hypothetical protein
MLAGEANGQPQNKSISNKSALKIAGSSAGLSFLAVVWI